MQKSKRTQPIDTLLCATLLATLFMLLRDTETMHLAPNARAAQAPHAAKRPDVRIDGDIAVSDRKQPMPFGDHDTGSPWLDGVVPYAIHSVFSSSDRQLIQNALGLISDQTKGCVTFVAYDSRQHDSWLHFVADEGCWSWVGSHGGEQWVSLAKGCVFTGTIVHEVMHALGFWHEQSRPDRDTYVSINWPNIEPGFESEFEIRSDADTRATPYDYYSAVHYEYNIFAVDKSAATIVPVDTSVDVRRMGKRDDLSNFDIKKIRHLYECR